MILSLCLPYLSSLAVKAKQTLVLHPHEKIPIKLRQRHRNAHALSDARTKLFPPLDPAVGLREGQRGIAASEQDLTPWQAKNRTDRRTASNAVRECACRGVAPDVSRNVARNQSPFMAR